MHSKRFLRLLILLLITLVSQAVIYAQVSGIDQYGYDKGLLSDHVTTLAQDSRGVLWVGTRTAGIFLIRNGLLEARGQLNNVVGYSIDRLEILPDGSLMIFSDKGTFIFDGLDVRKEHSAKVRPEDIPEWLTDIRPDILCAAKGDLGQWWIGTGNGLFVINEMDKYVQPIRDDKGFLQDAIEALLFDKNDHLWIGTRANGLLNYSGSHEDEGMRVPDSLEIVQFCPVGATTILCLTADGVVLQIDPHASGHDSVYFNPIDPVVRMLQDEEDRIWLTTRANELYLFRRGEMHRIPLNRWRQKGIAWVATSPVGVAIAELGDGSVVKVEDLNPGYPEPSFRVSSPGNTRFDDTPVAWIPDGAQDWYRVGSQGVMHIGRAMTAVESVYNTSDLIVAGCGLPSGEVVVALESGKLVLVRAVGQSREIELGASLGFEHVVCLQHTTNNLIWVGTTRRLWLIELNPERTRTTSMRVRYTGKPRSLDANSFTRAENGNVLFLADQSIHEEGVGGRQANAAPPSVFLSSVTLESGPIGESRFNTVAGPMLQQKERLVLPFGRSEIGFSFEAYSALGGMRPYQYEWKLAGAYEDWSGLSDKQTVRFTALSPGDYSFQVRACNSLGMCSVLAKPWEFTVDSAIWQQTLFWVVVFLMALGLVAGYFKWREGRIRAKNKREKLELDRRIRTLELEQKSLQLQMNPHFIFNALQNVSHSMSHLPPDEVKRELTQISRLMRTMLNMSRAQKVNLEDEVEFLKSYVDVSNMASAEPVKMQVSTPEGMDLFDIEIPPMLVQPLIENSIKYGATEIQLDISLQGSDVRIGVTDNGPGLDEAALKGHSTESTSVGLKLIRERLEAHGRSSGMTVSNVKDSHGQVSGAHVVLNVSTTGRTALN